MEPTQRRNTYTPVMEKTQWRTTQESEGKRKGALETAEQIESAAKLSVSINLFVFFAYCSLESLCTREI